MIFALIDEDGNVIASSDEETYYLFEYVCSPYENEIAMGNNVGEKTIIYDAFDPDCKPCVEIKNSDLEKLFKQWSEIIKKRPKKVFIKKEGNDYIFEGVEFAPRMVEQIDLKNLSFDKIDIFNEPEEKFNGGFHYANTNKNKNSEILNKIYSVKKSFGADIKFKNDFTINHSFFPEEFSTDEVKIKIIEALNYIGLLRYTEIDNKIFSFFGFAKCGMALHIIVNNKNEILTAYPNLWRKND